MPDTMQVTPQEISDLVRNTITRVYETIIESLAAQPASFSANDAAEALREAMPELQARLIHEGEQQAAAHRERP